MMKNLEAGPVLHLFKLLNNLPLKEHTEQTIYLAQVYYVSKMSCPMLFCNLSIYLYI